MDYRSITQKNPETGEYLTEEEWEETRFLMPEILKELGYVPFEFEMGKVGTSNYGGRFDKESMTMRIGPKSIDNDVVILHEMIHMHEAILERVPSFYHDKVYLCLYQELKEKISNLDELLNRATNLLAEQLMELEAGSHDILFFLKSLDLDLRMGYELGTIFEKRLPKQKDN